MDLEPSDYLELIGQKTCWYTTVWPLRVGALIGSAGTTPLDAITRFGFYLGAAFQIRDDLLNLVGDGGRVRQGAARRHSGGEADTDADPSSRHASADQRRSLVAFLARAGKHSDLPDDSALDIDAEAILELMVRYGSLEFAYPIRTGRGHCRLRVLPRCLRSGAAVGFARFHRGAHSIHAGQGLLTPASSPATRRIATRLSHYEGVVVDGEFWITYHVCLPRDANTCLASSGGSRSERAEGGRRVRVREGDSDVLQTVGMPVRLHHIVIDAHDLPGLARFWTQALGWKILSEREREIVIGTDENAPVGICFMPVTDPKSVKNRVHLDLTSSAADRLQEIDRLLALGARRVDIGQTGTESWTVLADPEGNEFCVVRPKDTLIR